MKGGAKVVVEPHRHEGIFVARGKEDALVTLNSTPGVAVYGEKRISVEVPPAPGADNSNPTKVEYRVWNPFRSKCKQNWYFSFVFPSWSASHIDSFYFLSFSQHVQQRPALPKVSYLPSGSLRGLGLTRLLL